MKFILLYIGTNSSHPLGPSSRRFRTLDSHYRAYSKSRTTFEQGHKETVHQQAVDIVSGETSAEPLNSGLSLWTTFQHWHLQQQVRGARQVCTNHPCSTRFFPLLIMLTGFPLPVFFVSIFSIADHYHPKDFLRPTPSY